MRPLLLLTLLASASAAQTPDSTAARRPGPSAGIVMGGTAAGLTAVLLGTLVMRTARVPEEGQGWAFLLYPVGAAVGVYDIRRASGRHGTFGATARGAVRGTFIAAAGILLVGYGVEQAFNQNDASGGELALFGGLAIALAAPPYFAAAGYDASDVTPVVLLGPDGERAAGLALRVAL